MLFATSVLLGLCLAQEASKIKSALYVPDPLPALEPQILGTFEPAAGVLADRVTYGTEFGMRVPAIVYRPKKSGTGRPGFIVVNGHGGDKYSWYAYWTGIAFARLGAVVLTYDPIGEGERNAQHKSGTRAHDKYVPPPEMGRRMGGLMIADISQAVSYLSQRGDVDPTRIAAGGYSMGSFILALACAVETRLKACVLVGGGNLDGPGGYWDSSSKQMCQSIPYKSLQFLGDRPAAIFALQARHAATLIYNGSADETVDIPHHGEDFFRDMRDRTVKKVGDASKVFAYAFSEGTGHRPYWVTLPVVE
jgi:dienelactone hydrolase